MKKINTLILLLLLGVSFFGCKKDEFEAYNKIDELSILFPADTTFAVAQLDTLRIDPSISGMAANKNYSYKWTLYRGAEIVPLSSEKDLEIAIELPSGDYSLTFEVVDDATGVKAISELMKLHVNSAFYEGWVIGSNVGDLGRLSFLRADGQVYLKPLEDVNQKTYSGKVIAAYSGVTVDIFGSGLKQILYFTNTGLTVFDPETFLQISDLNEYFFKPMQFIQKPAYGSNGYNMDQYLINENNLYMANGVDLFGGENDFGKFSTRIEGDYSMFPFIFKNSNFTTYFYDNKNKRFFSASYMARTLNTPSTAMTNGQYRLNNIGRTMIAADASVSNNYLSLMKDEANYYLYAFNFYTSTASGSYTQLSSAPPEIDQLTGFTASSKFQHVYYSSKNKIYKLISASGAVFLIHEFPAGYEIADCKMLKRGANANKQLVVAVNKGGAGEIHYVYLDDLGNYDNSKANTVFTGFGKIVNISYRMPY